MQQRRVLVGRDNRCVQRLDLQSVGDVEGAQHWRIENELTMMKQLGLLPASWEYEPVIANNRY